MIRKKDIEKLRTSGVFDEDWYLKTYPDVQALGMDPIKHYLWLGARLGRGMSAPHYQSEIPKKVAFADPEQGSEDTGLLHHLCSATKHVSADYVPLSARGYRGNLPIKLIAFYLPQFHPIPENDQWWGEGFTEWTNVRPAKPQFKGQYQPHVPGELGYYNLLEEGVQHRQVELAKLYGIGGFCFYLYWFGGHRLLEKPVDKWLADTSLELPFCVCWANENWSRRWDGLESEVLVAQRHSPEDDLAFIADVARYLRDPRYICIDGRPLLLVYRPGLLPSAKETAQRWRQWCRENGVGEIHLAYTQSFEQVHPSAYGFDAAIEFPPNLSDPPDLTKAVEPLGNNFAMTVYDWRVLHERSLNYIEPGYPLYRSVCPSWDNTARRKNSGTAFINQSPELYRAWLANAVAHTLKTFPCFEQRLVFVNAWNEWAEGAHLEPDQRYGYAWLQATRDALEGQTRPVQRGRLVVVSHDAHPHGAQLLALNMARTFRELGFETDMIVLGDGPLLSRFAEVATVHRLDLDVLSDQAVARKLTELRRGGADVAIANTTVSGLLVPRLRAAGFRTVSLIHELPGILASYKLQSHARSICEHADKVVFPATQVQKGFESFAGKKIEQAIIRPQGLYNQAQKPTASGRTDHRHAMRVKLGLPAHGPIVICVGYGDMRKGFDLFVEMCLKLIQSGSALTAVWVGDIESPLKDEQLQRIHAAKCEGRFVFTGLVTNPQDYFAAADIFALTSREDPFPSVVLEALDAAVPVVAFEGAGGFAELLAQGCGVMVPDFDTHAMADTVQRLLANPSGLIELGQRGRNAVQDNFHFRHYLHDLLALAGCDVPRVSVIVPNYNYARYIEQRLASIVAQTLPIFELIVLDDASTDDSVAVIERALAGCSIPSRLIVNAHNSRSVSAQWTRGVDLARGEYVWIAEADDTADPRLLARLVQRMQEEGADFGFCDSWQIDADDMLIGETYAGYMTEFPPDTFRQSFAMDGTDFLRRFLAVKNVILNVSSVVFRREALARALDAAGKDLMGYSVAGDWRLYAEICAGGGRLVYDSEALNGHRRHATSVTHALKIDRHLSEIEFVQREIASRVHLDPGTMAKQKEHLESCRRHLRA